MTVSNLVTLEAFFSRGFAVPKIVKFFRYPHDKLTREVEVTDFDFTPYFYVEDGKRLPDEISKVVFLRTPGKTSLFGIKTTKLHFMGLTKDSLKQIYYDLEAKGVQTFEADLTFKMRYIVDKQVNFAQEKRVHYIDIETYACNDVTAPEPVTSLVVYDNFLDKYISWAWHPKIDLSKSTDTFRVFKSEEDMFANYLEWYCENYPDIITGWYSNGFDIPYLFHRIQRIGLEPSLLSQVMFAVASLDKFENKYSVRIFGVELIDLMQATILNIYKNPPDYSLNTCGQFFLGEQKEKIESVSELWDTCNIDRLVEYNRKDVELCVKLDKTLGLLSYYNAMQQIIPMPLSDIDMKSKIIDYYFFNNYKDIAFPSKKRGEKEEVEGGFVKEPPRGLFKNVFVLDVSSMYPNIYITFNISPETLDETNGTYDINGHKFLSTDKKSGLLPDVLSKLLVERYKIKAERDRHEKGTSEYKKNDEHQTAFKEVMNSCYGVMALSSYRLFNPIVANSVTYCGRSMIRWAIKYIEDNLDAKVLYADTDSMFLKLPDEFSEEECVAKASEIRDSLNANLSKFCMTMNVDKKDSNLSVPKRLLLGDSSVHTLAFEFEKYFATIIFTGAKKRYMSLVKYQDGKKRDEVYARGFENMRGDVPLPIKGLLIELYKDILNMKSQKYIIDKLESKFDIIVKTIGLYELGFSKYINMHPDKYKVKPQHVRAAEYANKHLGTSFTKSSKPRIVYVKKVPKKFPKTDVVAFTEDIDLRKMGFVLDVDKYKRKLLLDKLRDIFDVLKWRSLDVDLKQRVLFEEK
jgi:DNA polymerase elongation subunit (family B)